MGVWWWGCVGCGREEEEEEREEGEEGGGVHCISISQVMFTGFDRNGHCILIDGENYFTVLSLQSHFLEAVGESLLFCRNPRLFYLGEEDSQALLMAQSLSARSIGKIADTTKAVPDRARGGKVHQWFPCIERFMNAPRGGRMGAC